MELLKKNFCVKITSTGVLEVLQEDYEYSPHGFIRLRMVHRKFEANSRTSSGEMCTQPKLLLLHFNWLATPAASSGIGSALSARLGIVSPQSRAALANRCLGIPAWCKPDLGIGPGNCTETPGANPSVLPSPRFTGMYVCVCIYIYIYTHPEREMYTPIGRAADVAATRVYVYWYG